MPDRSKLVEAQRARYGTDAGAPAGVVGTAPGSPPAAPSTPAPGRRRALPPRPGAWSGETPAPVVAAPPVAAIAPPASSATAVAPAAKIGRGRPPKPAAWAASHPGAAGSSGPSGYIAVPPRVVQTEGGDTHVLYDAKGAAAALANRDKLPNRPLQDYIIGRGYAHVPNLATPTELAEAEAPRWYETIFGWFEPFDYPRRYAWQLAYKLGEALPDAKGEDEPETATSEVGDALRWYAGKVGAGLYAQTLTNGGLASAASGGVSKLLQWTGASDTLNDDGAADYAEEAGRRFYDALSRGKLYEAGATRRREVTWGLPGIDLADKATTPAPMGVDVLDFAVPKDLAEKAAAASANRAERLFWSTLATDLGREVTGLGMEMAIDPLWLAGPARGTKMVHEGGKVYEIGRPLVAAIAQAERLGVGGADDLAKAAVRLVVGTDEEAAAARKLFDQALAAAEEAGASRSAAAAELARAAREPATAIAEAQRQSAAANARVGQMITEFGKDPGQAADLAIARRGLARLERDAARLGSSPRVASAYLVGLSRKAALEARTLGASAETLRRGMGFARGARSAGSVTEVGRLAWHLPFATGSRYLAPAETGARIASAANQVLPTMMVRELGKLGEWWRGMQADDVVRRAHTAELAGRDANEVLSSGEQLVYAWRKAMGGELASSIRAIPLVVLDTMAKVLGTRHIQPFISRIKTATEIEALGPRGRYLMRVPFLGGRYLRLERVAPEIWSKYQGAVVEYFRRMGSMEATLVNAATSLAVEAKRAVGVRQRLARAELPRVQERVAVLSSQLARATPAEREGLAAVLIERQNRLAELQRWLSRQYDAADVLLEAGGLVESGAGLLQRRPELVRVAEAIEDLVKRHKEAAGGSDVQVREALANMVRFMEGNPKEFDDLATRQAMLVELLQDTDAWRSATREELQRVASAHRARFGALRGLLAAVKPPDLVVALERVRESRIGALGEDDVAFVRRVVLEATGDEALAGEVLRRASVAMSIDDPAEAVRALAEMVLHRQKGPEGMPPGRIVAQAVRSLAVELEEESEMLGRLASGDLGRLTEEEAFGRVLAFEFEREIARVRAMVGEDRWDAFVKWADDEATGPLGVAGDLAAGAPRHEEVRAGSLVYGKRLPGGLRAQPSVVAEALAGAAQAAGERMRAMFATMEAAGVSAEKLEALTPESLRKLYELRVGGPPVRGERVARTAEQLRAAREAHAVALRELAAAEDKSMNTWDAAAGVYEGIVERMRAAGLTEAEVEATFLRTAYPTAHAALEAFGAAIHERVAAETTAKGTRAALARELRPVPIEDRALLERARLAYGRTRALGAGLVQLVRDQAGGIRKGLDTLGVRGGKLGELHSSELFARRVDEAVRGVATREEAIAHVRAALEELVPLDDPWMHRALDQYAERVGSDAFARQNVAGARGRVLAGRELRKGMGMAKSQALGTLEAEAAASRKAAGAAVVAEVGKVRGQVRAELGQVRLRLRDVEPRLAPPPGSAMSGARPLEAWERDLWRDFSAITQGLTAEDQVLAGFAALRYLPEIPAQLGQIYDDLAKVYPRIMGRRLGEVPEELVHVVEELASIVKSYELLYETHGMGFVKSPMEMLRVWGVTDYVPHILAPSEKVRTGKLSGATLAAAGDVRGRGSLDQILSLDMDAARLRTIDGTINEINAGVQSVSFTLDPQMLVARYLQANQAISAKEFLYALLRGKVIRAVAGDTKRGLGAHLVAAEQDLVPLFRSPNPDLDIELLVRGDRAAWEAVLTPDQVDRAAAAIAEWSAGVRAKRPDSMFASWLHEIPTLQGGANAEEMLFRIRGAEFRLMRAGDAKAPAELFDPLALHAAAVEDGLEDAAAWDQVAEQMHRRATDFLRSDLIRKVDGPALAAYFAPDAELWRLYVPRAVARSMEDLFEMEKLEPSGPLGIVKSLLDRFNSFFKVRVTVLSIAFSARNAASNVLSNVLDLGVHGALSPKTNAMAIQLAAALPYADTFGTLARAGELLGEGRRAGETARDWAIRKAQHAAFHADMIPSLLRHGIDLGDGVTREVDDAIKLLREHGVISTSFTQVSDVGRLERGWSELVMAAGLGTGLDKVKHWASVAEDWCVVGLSMAMTGGWPVTVGKNIGAELAHFAENQARLVNFIGNVRRSGDMRVAADAAAKFLFDYNDLTAVQKVWVRTLIPFFTWTFKNIELQLEMMRTAPYFYAQFNRILLEGFPRIAAAADATQDGTGFNPLDPSTPTALRLRQPHTLSMVRLPLPKVVAGFDGAYLEGLGLPQEAFVEQLGMMGALADIDRYSQDARFWDERPFMRFLAQSHFLVKMAIEYAAGHNSYYDRPIDKLTNGRLIDQAVNALRKFPLVGPDMANAMEEATGLYRVNRYNARTGTYGTDVLVHGLGNWMFANIPWSRVARDSAAASDLYHVSLATDVAAESAMGGEVVRELPRTYRVLDALTGVRLVQEDADMRRRVYEKRLAEASENQLEERGVTREVDRTSIRQR